MARKIVFLLSFLFIRLLVVAQDNNVEMADTFRANGKIFVVVAVIVTIFAGIIAYLVRFDRKLTKLEKNTNNF
jgi:tRNA(Phe) wybutosine-synthesizing methylase Tyw3